MNTPDIAYLDESILTWADLWPTRDLLVAARQQSTREWFRFVAPTLHLCVSERVLDAVLAGEERSIQQRFPLIADAEILVEEPAVSIRAERWIDAGACAMDDRTPAHHLLIAAQRSVDLVITWDERISRVLTGARRAPGLTDGLTLPAVCSPEQMLQSIQL